MNQLSQLASRYYDTLESLVTLRAVPVRLWMAVVTGGVLFTVAFVRLVLGAAGSPGAAQYFLMGQMLVSEGLVLFLVMLIRQARDRAARQRVAAALGRADFASLAAAKTALLTHLFHQPTSAFLRLAEDVRKCIELQRNPARGLGFRQDDFFNFFYHPDARPRIVALCLAAVAALSALTLSSAEAREEGLAMLYAIRAHGLKLWLTGVVILAGAVFAAGLVHRIAWWVGERLARFLAGPQDHDLTRVRYLLGDLVRQHEFTPPAPTAMRPRGRNRRWNNGKLVMNLDCQTHPNRPSSLHGPRPASSMPG